ncbi:ATP-binding protein [Arthrobacter sp. ISL-30]|uniref:ATP-binding protein n=1 Tax=Arthrobacter sp. ISL-30 TaxID=2819109 RepID=UPI001BE624A8|nr:ATP-binding protein [Arthrobacter sp. ISL-30]MBT2512614.1 ATP-binding protein [Arthrobacter sp. ISL-30]
MTEMVARRGYRGESVPEAIEAVHTELDSLWEDADFVPEMDRMTFTTAVIEAASNIVQHAEPVAEAPVELGVDISVWSTRLVARVTAFNAKEPFASPPETGLPDDDSESGRGLALIEALVTTVTFERQDATNTWILTRNSTSAA